MGARRPSVRRFVRSLCERTFVKSEAKIEARRLRAESGLPISAIASRLGVAKSSVSRWVRDVELTAEQHAALRSMNPLYNAQLRGQAARSASARAVRSVAQQHGRALAHSGNALHMYGCMLYWAEGAKSRNYVAFANSDAHMLALFLRFLRKCYGVTDEGIALGVNCHVNNGLSAPEIVQWWLDRLGLPRTCAEPHSQPALAASRGLRATYSLRNRSAGRVLDVHRPEHLRRDAGVADMDRPEWLDLRQLQRKKLMRLPSVSRVANSRVPNGGGDAVSGDRVEDVAASSSAYRASTSATSIRSWPCRR